MVLWRRVSKLIFSKNGFAKKSFVKSCGRKVNVRFFETFLAKVAFTKMFM